MRPLALVLCSAAAFAPMRTAPMRQLRPARAIPDDTWEARFTLEQSWGVAYPSPHAPPPREDLDGKPVNARADVLLWPHDAVDALLRDFEQDRSAEEEPAVASWVDNLPDQEAEFDLGLPREFRG